MLLFRVYDVRYAIVHVDVTHLMDIVRMTRTVHFPSVHVTDDEIRAQHLWCRNFAIAIAIAIVFAIVQRAAIHDPHKLYALNLFELYHNYWCK